MVDRQQVPKKHEVLLNVTPVAGFHRDSQLHKRSFIRSGMEQWVWRNAFFVTASTWDGQWWCKVNANVMPLTKVFDCITVSDKTLSDFTTHDSCVRFIAKVQEEGDADKCCRFELQPFSVEHVRRLDTAEAIATELTLCQNKLPWPTLKKWVVR